MNFGSGRKNSEFELPLVMQENGQSSLKFNNLVNKMKPLALLIGICGALIIAVMPNIRAIALILTICLEGALFVVYLANYVLSKDDGDNAMKEVSIPIQSGAKTFMKVQYTFIAKFSLIVAVIIFMSYQFRPSEVGVDKIGSKTLGFIGTFTFLIGASCSAIAGYISMIIGSRSSLKVACASKQTGGYFDALKICFRGGAFSAILSMVMCVGGLTLLFCIFYASFVYSGLIFIEDLPIVLVGFGFGASFSALFAQLAGGVYTKAADVGADLVGKIEYGLNEDDKTNPGVFADLVGDLVGDLSGSSSDIFESLSAEIIGSAILGGTLVKQEELSHPALFILFPLLVHAMDIVVSGVGIMVVCFSRNSSDIKKKNPMETFRRGYIVSSLLAAVSFISLCRWCFYDENYEVAWVHFALCGMLGLLASIVFILNAQYFTDYNYKPVKSIADASTTGAATNIIVGLAVGFKSCVAPAFAVVIAVISSYWLGRTAGFEDERAAGLFATCVTTMGFLSSAAFVLSTNNFGPIADNSGGIIELSDINGNNTAARVCTDNLDAAGNVTKALTKGYSIGSAALACFVLFGAFMDEFALFSGQPFESVDMTRPEVLLSSLMGVTMVFWFTSLCFEAVGKAAMEVVTECKRQFMQNPGILEGLVKPDYNRCILIVTKAALREMRFPGLLAAISPLVVGAIGRVLASLTGQPMLSPEMLFGFLSTATVVGICLATVLDNAGGAWDNAKKYVELPETAQKYGGKNSEAHKASIVGDTVGDPSKDTAGPSIHVLIKLLSTIMLIFAPLFVIRKEIEEKI
eukprot:TRINITY_DN425014_c0_g1_i1.p1 TRINITY_DN425014_c0_g1~~TRINITY_DN425014_c0_g1_i1.p1  ORF type:complete len:804 (-),score=231.23 TRINITY_DN425014_c0_g1_i1:196-2607(-)